ncbi:DUF1850 domain-containing protein [Defluviimonas sp. WL0002]|uniref:DUF1850 domain-containing protein n=1 Tax=Albidovulum marisflavi TaxID=2984159 RepID=A0ABT2ZAK5_9RHOB|nr:DUF1850 domain-containing protein [Defluviimonas sp. WL0002]MCV2868075.1 DUF1850 domain-containing protein [Defluviimonas sp. WL0002]
MSTCLAVGALLLSLPSPVFSLEWTHSVEKTLWREEWRITEGAFHLDKAMVKGSGAGMEPGDGAVLQDGWWVWTPDLPPQQELALAASGATGAGWRLCSGGDCHELGGTPGTALLLAPCAGS